MKAEAKVDGDGTAIDRRNARGEGEADPEARPDYGVRKDTYAQIGNYENHQKAAKDEPLECGKRDPKS